MTKEKRIRKGIDGVITYPAGRSTTLAVATTDVKIYKPAKTDIQPGMAFFLFLLF